MYKFLFALLLTIFSSSIVAEEILYYQDYSISSTDDLSSAIEIISSEHNITTANTIDEFESALESGNFRLVVLFLQDEPHNADEFVNFLKYVDGGGKVIFADASKEPSWSKLFGFSYSGNDNEDTIKIINPLLSSYLTTDSFEIYNPGYKKFSLGLTPQDKTLATFSNGDAAILWIENRVLVNGFLSDTTINNLAYGRTATNNIFLSQINFVLNPQSALYTADVPLNYTPIAMIFILITALLALKRRSYV